MSKKKVNKDKISIVRSSTAEYLTFIAATGEGGVEVHLCRRKHLAIPKNDGNAL